MYIYIYVHMYKLYRFDLARWFPKASQIAVPKATSQANFHFPGVATSPSKSPSVQPEAPLANLNSSA